MEEELKKWREDKRQSLLSKENQYDLFLVPIMSFLLTTIYSVR